MIQSRSPKNPIPTIRRRMGNAWYVLQLAPIRIIVATLAVAGLVTALQLGARAMHIKSQSGPGFVFGLLLILVMCGAYVAYVRLVEQRPTVELGATGAISDFSTGLLVGSGLFSATALILVLLGVWSIDGANSWTTLIYPFAAAMGAAFIEEILFRGVLFRIAEESLGSWLALALSAVIFGLMHAFNPGATVVSIVAISLEAGVLLAAAYMYSRRLWLPIGLHFAWNFTEAGIFGASTSGHEAHGLLASRLTGPDMLTGGAFGPEASIVAIAVCLTVGITFLVLARRNNHIVAPVWRR